MSARAARGDRSAWKPRWTIRSRDRRACRASSVATLSAALAIGALLPACTTARERPSPPAREVVSAASPPALKPPPSNEPAAAPAAAPPTSALVDANASFEKKTPTPRRAGDVLATFYGALRELAAGTRKQHVRVLWLGDSHAAADFWSGSLRAALQKRFGNAGPGFLHLGYRDYRHDGVKTGVEGKWKMRPVNPATRTVTGDGIFGLGGILFIASAEAPRASVMITEPTTPPRLSWDLCYRLSSPKDELMVSLTGRPEVAVRATEAEPPGVVRHLVLTSDVTSPSFGLMTIKGNPEVCGVVVEADPETHPGVVLDTLGINGARFATPLAWNEVSWGTELARRAPELVVLEFGTNELSDYPVRPAVFTEQIRANMSRIRKVRADVDCVVLAPTDRADTEERLPIVRDAIREGALESGCAFWDTYTIMGGRGAIRVWGNETPPRATKDGVHLSWRGYRELGTKLAEDILRGF